MDKAAVFGTADAGSIPAGRAAYWTKWSAQSKYLDKLGTSALLNMKWFVYIVKCRDGYLYTGITQNIKRRLIEHNTDNKLGSKFSRVRRPAELVYKEVSIDKSNALKRELEIKGWSRKKKLELIDGADLNERKWMQTCSWVNEIHEGPVAQR